MSAFAVELRTTARVPLNEWVAANGNLRDITTTTDDDGAVHQKRRALLCNVVRRTVVGTVVPLQIATQNSDMMRTVDVVHGNPDGAVRMHFPVNNAPSVHQGSWMGSAAPALAASVVETVWLPAPLVAATRLRASLAAPEQQAMDGTHPVTRADWRRHDDRTSAVLAHAGACYYLARPEQTQCWNHGEMQRRKKRKMNTSAAVARSHDIAPAHPMAHTTMAVVRAVHGVRVLGAHQPNAASPNAIRVNTAPPPMRIEGSQSSDIHDTVCGACVCVDVKFIAHVVCADAPLRARPLHSPTPAPSRRGGEASSCVRFWARDDLLGGTKATESVGGPFACVCSGEPSTVRCVGFVFDQNPVAAGNTQAGGGGELLLSLSHAPEMLVAVKLDVSSVLAVVGPMDADRANHPCLGRLTWQPDAFEHALRGPVHVDGCVVLPMGSALCPVDKDGLLRAGVTRFGVPDVSRCIAWHWQPQAASAGEPLAPSFDASTAFAEMVAGESAAGDAQPSRPRATVGTHLPAYRVARILSIQLTGQARVHDMGGARGPYVADMLAQELRADTGENVHHDLTNPVQSSSSTALTETLLRAIVNGGSTACPQGESSTHTLITRRSVLVAHAVLVVEAKPMESR